jgi:DNA-directed RNA polymerase specialized sigma24 family protein
MDADTYFGSEWAETARRIAHSLARHGVPACDRDDVLQETALRLYRAWDTVDQQRGVEAFARTVALNVWRDAVRRPVHQGEVLGDVPDVPCGDVVERTTLARMELGRVRRALGSLRPAEQRLLHEAIVAEVGGEPALAPAAVRMARMRARRQLVAVLRTASAWTAAVTGAVRAVRSHRAVLTATGVAAVLALGALRPPSALPPREVLFRPATTHRTGSVAAMPPRPAAAPGVVRADAPARTTRRRVAVRAVPPKPAHVDLGTTSVDVLVDLETSVARAQVRDRDGGVPACVSTALGPLDRRVDC